jgi:hypothetical protein
MPPPNWIPTVPSSVSRGTLKDAPPVIEAKALPPKTLCERAPILFLALGTLLVAAYALIVPPFQVPDEDRHLWRAYSVSEMHLRGPARTQVPVSFLELNERFPRLLETMTGKRAVRPELARWLRQPLNEETTAGIENPRANLYSFVPYLTTGLVLKVGRLARWSPLASLYAGRLANGAVYLWLVYMSLRILPEFQLLLLTIALTPMSLYLAASFSADSLTLGLNALFAAYVFRLAFDTRIRNVSMRDLLVLIGLLVVLALCKFNLWTALLVALIPTEKFGSRTRAVLSITGCALAEIAAAVIWQAFNSPAISAFRQLDPRGPDAASNAFFVLMHPVKFFAMILLTDFWLFRYWCQEFVGAFGHAYSHGHLSNLMSWPLVLVYLGGILLAAYTRSAHLAITRRQKWIAALFVFLTYISLHVLLWVLEAPPDFVRQATISFAPIPAIQGRYFLPLALLALIGVKGRFALNGWWVAGAVGLIAGVNAFALRTIWLLYS